MSDKKLVPGVVGYGYMDVEFVELQSTNGQYVLYFYLRFSRGGKGLSLP